MITLASLNLETISPSEIGELLIEAKKAYYTGGKPTMDDHTYDTLEEILHQKTPHHRIFSKVGHPNFDTGFDKKTHVMPMGSQNKVTSYDDFVHYFELKKTTLESGFVVEPKCDGISLEIEYQKGELVDAITRGDGFVGDVITQNVVHMQGFVAQAGDFSGFVRCEIMVVKKDFEALNSVIKKNVKPALSREGGPASAGTEGFYSNPRNAASGLSQRLDGKFSDYCSLYAVDCYGDQTPFSTEIEKMAFLKGLGFTTVETNFCTDFSQVEDIYQKFLTGLRLDYPFEIDGLVIKINNLSVQRELGAKNNRPKGQVAYKFPAQSNHTQLKSVVWQVGPLGTITPVAEVEPIELAGAIVTFASLANHSLIIEKDINLGDIVEISRRGDVIPHIEKVVSKVNPGHIEIPTICPVCQTLLVTESKFIRCPNALCLGRVLGSLRLFCDTLEIKGLSDKTIAKLYTANRVRLPGDFFKLTIEDIADLENLGTKSAKNIINQINSKKNLTLKQVIDAAIIPNFSAQRISQLISAGFNTPEKILNITVENLSVLPGFKITLAQKVVEGIALRRTWVESILQNITLKEVSANDKFKDLNICITGELSRPRKEYVDIIESSGGKVQSAVSSNTSFLLSNEVDSNSSKFVTAKKLGIKIVSEADFQKLL